MAAHPQTDVGPITVGAVLEPPQGESPLHQRAVHPVLVVQDQCEPPLRGLLPRLGAVHKTPVQELFNQEYE